MQKFLTIVIPTFNEEKYIARTLYSIASQKGIEKIPIIIADANSTDRTLDIITKVSYQLGLNIKIIPGGLPAVGRNAGAKLVETPYILFLDADVTFTKPNSIKKALRALTSHKYDMVSSTPVYFGDRDLRASFMFWLNKWITMAMSYTHPFAIGGFTMVYKGLFNNLGGYDEQAMQSEDWLLSKQVNPKRFKIIPSLVTQDNRRFKNYGYMSMVKLMFWNWINRNNIKHFYKNQNYWR
jgi:glycosyltransferase involved in cell wall biosynthesis